jgi:uncharacterized protein (TIGR02996 family)
MSDRDALLAAIRAQPDEDTPRLMFADWLEENDPAPGAPNGPAARANFIRAQVELARTPPWEPFAVKCRWRRPDIATGKPFLGQLPAAGYSQVSWAPLPFRRGFGWAIEVRSAGMWDEFAEPLFDFEPIGRVSFWHATLDAWRHIAASECVRNFRELVLETNPIEPLIALRDRPAARGITDIRFRRASGAGMPEVVEDLFLSPLGGAVRGLHFHTGYESTRALIDAINTGGPLERLSFSVMGVTAEYARQLFDGPAASSLKEFSLRNEPLGGAGLAVLASDLPPGLLDLALDHVGVQPAAVEALARSGRVANLRRLDLSRNALPPRATRVLSLSRPLAGLRALALRNCSVGDKGVRHLTQSKFWPNLVELDLRQNPISGAGVRHLLDAPVPPDLSALVLDGGAFGGDGRAALARKYGDAVVYVASEIPG